MTAVGRYEMVVQSLGPLVAGIAEVYRTADLQDDAASLATHSLVVVERTVVAEVGN